MNINLSYLIILIILIIMSEKCYKFVENYTNRKSVCNNLDGRCYSISTKYKPSSYYDASTTLAHLNKYTIKLLRHLRKKFLFENNGTPYCKDAVKYLLHNYDPHKIIENVPTSIYNTSYVEDKGKVFAVCLRERNTGNNNIHKNHILEFVLIHELAHLSCFNIGHGNEFWEKFKFLLKEATDIGLHTPINYKIKPINYCGLVVNYNPFFDKRVPSI